MTQPKLPASPALKSERPPVPQGGISPSGAGGVPPEQPQTPLPSPPEEGPMADSKSDPLPSTRDGRPDRPGGAVGIPEEAHYDGGDAVQFDWHPSSVAQVVLLNTKGRRFIKSIFGTVASPSTGRGPTTLTFRKVGAGQSLSSGVALHSGSIDLIGPGNVDISKIEQILAMAPEEDRFLELGDCIAADFSGGMANARGGVTIKLENREP